MDGIPSIAPIIIEPANEPAEHQAPHDRRKPKVTRRPSALNESEANAVEGTETESEAAGDATHLLDLDA